MQTIDLMLYAGLTILFLTTVASSALVAVNRSLSSTAKHCIFLASIISIFLMLPFFYYHLYEMIRIE